MRAALALCVVVTLGCTNVTTMKIRRTAAGDITIESPKDVRWDHAHFEAKPGQDYVVTIDGYSSNANVDVVNAQAAREATMVQSVTSAVLEGLVKGASMAVKP